MSRGKPSYVSHIQRHVLTNTIFATHILIISINCRIHPTSEAIQVKVVCSFLGGSFQCVEQIGSGPQEGLKGSRFTALLGSNGKGLETLTFYMFLRLHNGNFWIILTWMLKIINWLWWKKKTCAIACLILIGYVTDCLPVICYMTRVEDWWYLLWYVSVTACLWILSIKATSVAVFRVIVKQYSQCHLPESSSKLWFTPWQTNTTSIIKYFPALSNLVPRAVFCCRKCPDYET